MKTDLNYKGITEEGAVRLAGAIVYDAVQDLVIGPKNLKKQFLKLHSNIQEYFDTLKKWNGQNKEGEKKLKQKETHINTLYLEYLESRRDYKKSRMFIYSKNSIFPLMNLDVEWLVKEYCRINKIKYKLPEIRAEDNEAYDDD